jgi:hypothetical protein
MSCAAITVVAAPAETVMLVSIAPFTTVPSMFVVADPAVAVTEV